MIGIGKIVTHAAPRPEAVATQGQMNPYHGIDGLRHEVVPTIKGLPGRASGSP